MVKSAERWKKRWHEKATAAVEDFREGVLAPERNPIEEALKKYEKWKSNLLAAIKEDRWKKTMAKIPMEEWQTFASTIGADRYSGGIEAKKEKQANFVDKWRPHLEAIQKDVRALPDVTDLEREKRMLENLRRLKKAKGIWR